jgi:hypothetical protein
VHGLSEDVRVPRVARAGREAHHVHAQARRLLALGDDVVPGVTGERFGRRLGVRLLGLNLQLCLLRLWFPGQWYWLDPRCPQPDVEPWRFLLPTYVARGTSLIVVELAAGLVMRLMVLAE